MRGRSEVTPKMAYVCKCFSLSVSLLRCVFIWACLITNVNSRCATRTILGISAFSVLVRSLVQNRLNFPGICCRNGLSPPLNMSSWPPHLGPHPYGLMESTLPPRDSAKKPPQPYLARYFMHSICPHAHSLTHQSSTKQEDKEGKKQDDPASRP